MLNIFRYSRQLHISYKFALVLVLIAYPTASILEKSSGCEFSDQFGVILVELIDYSVGQFKKILNSQPAGYEYLRSTSNSSSTARFSNYEGWMHDRGTAVYT